MRKSVLCFVDYYYPGFKGGGPIKSTFNLVNELGDYIDFYILTRGFDLGEQKLYSNIIFGEWNQVGKAKVYYFTPSELKKFKVLRIINQNKVDTYYFNSFFSFYFSILPFLYISIMTKVKDLGSIVIAPRGEFSISALKSKYFKKKIVLKIITLCLPLKLIKWHSTSVHEKDDIERLIKPQNGNIINLPNFVSLHYSVPHINFNSLRKEAVFFSRIVPHKNLDFLLCVLQSVRSIWHLDIYGTIEDKVYWEKCLDLIKKLPKNITVQYKGEINTESAYFILPKYSLFILPTKGENFGHVISEALNCSVPVLISDLTPWKQIDNEALKVLSLDRINDWSEFLDSFSEFDNNKVKNIKIKAFQTSLLTLSFTEELKKQTLYFFS